MKAVQLHICDRGAFRRSAWNQDFGRVSFEVFERPGEKTEDAKDVKVRCITEKQLAALKARQSGSLQVIDHRGRR